MDYSRLRAAALKVGGDEEAVTVDTRALIDKVLARYSGEWTTLRELIQNAADAQATTVTIKWETLPSTTVPLPTSSNRSDLLKHTITNHTLRRLVVQNDGQPFTKTDWGRLKRIAEGNPDETKIGAFGVGFYSVFADCEEPFVSSGREAMAFYWKGNALFTRKLQLPEEQCSNNTAFVLDYRNTTSPVPNLLSIGQFLATSLTFVALQNIEFWIDDWKILSLQKKASPSVEVAIPRDIDTKTKEGLMKLSTVERMSTQIDATFMSALGWKPQVASTATKAIDSYGAGSSEYPSLRSFFSRLTANNSQSGLRGKAAKEEKATQEAISEDLLATSSSSIFLRVMSAAIKTNITTAFAAELERATKKPPPKIAKLSILTSSYDEMLASESSIASGPTAQATDVFASVLPSKKPGGRIFIGFPTTQTTGAGMHVSAPSVIPTVEREAIDLNARWVRTWNMEMLRVAGIVTRLAFSNEMSDLNQKVREGAESSNSKGPGFPPEIISKFLPEALHILKTYTFEDSTPSAHVAQIIEEAFWTAYKKASIEVYSSQGVLPTTKVRVGSVELGKFVSGIPVILDEMKSSPFVKKLTDFGLVRDITVSDVRQELEAKAMNQDQLAHFISWAGKAALSRELDPASRQSLLDVAVATIGDGDNEGEIIALGSIQHYLSTQKIPANLPIPPTTMPFAFTSNTPTPQLQALGWQPLEIVPWLRFLIDSGPRGDGMQDLTKSPDFATKILVVLSKNWDSLSISSKNSVVSALENITVIPTKMGMRRPEEAYFTSVKLFDDLPTIQGCSAIKDKFLAALGVRKTVELDTIFTRLLNPNPDSPESQKKWSHMELLKYLASVRDDIPAADMKKLTEAKICPAETGPAGMEPTKGSAKLYKVSELFEPKDSLRALKLRLLHWPGPPGSWRPASPEGRFLGLLGLRAYPSVPELVEMMSSSDASLRDNSMVYFISNHHVNGYAGFNLASSTKSFLPIEGKGTQLVSPSECYTNGGSAVLGFDILKKALHMHASKFRVARDPPIAECISRLLARPPTNHQTAVTLFEYFTTRLSDLGEASLSKLRDAPIVPIYRKTSAGAEKPSSSTLVFVKPQGVYLGSSPAYGDIFDFVDFGANANAFLFKCGAKNEPTKTEIARLACSEPARLLSVLQSSEKYLNLLRSLAGDVSVLRRDKELFKKMKTSPFLLASREISASKSKGTEEADEEEAPMKQYQLAPANQIVILDDYISYRLFRDYLICAPEEDILENFYLALGSQTLGSLVQEDLRIGSHSERQDGAAWLRKHVLERSKIFLYEYSKYRKDSIKHDAKWLEKNLAVVAVRSVALRRSLHGHGRSHTEKRTAASARTDDGYALYVAAEGRPDMYQVGQAVCQLLLNRPSQQAYFFFEPFLKLDLLDLRARGYNVDRILRAKAAEARIAEEGRRKALEAEQQKIRETEAEWAQQNRAAEAARQAAKTPEPVMPGSFKNDSPEDTQAPPAMPPSKRGKNLFSNLSRRLGFDKGEEAQHHLQNFFPEQEQEQRQEQKPVASPEQPRDGKNPTGNQDDGRVTSPAVVQQNLLNAIKSTRAHHSSTLFSPPSTSEVKEQSTYCDSTPAQNITFVAEGPRGMRIFIDKGLAKDAHQFLSGNSAAIGTFETLLSDVATIYGLSSHVLHIFYDEHGGTIAFNSQGSIFCNLRFFLQLHAAKETSASGGQTTSEARSEATSWWWVVIAHELAHNIVKPHNADHSYYTESFIQQYFPKMVAKAVIWSAHGSGQQNHGISPTPSTGLGTSVQRRSLPPPPPYELSPTAGGGNGASQSLLD